MPLFLALAGTVLAFGVTRLAHPVATLRQQRADLAQLRQEKADLAREIDRLAEHKSYLATEAGQEAAARRHGYLRPGERRLMFVPRETPSTDDSGPRSPRPKP